MSDRVSKAHVHEARNQILILEDSKPQSDALTATLRAGGYSVTAAGDGIEGLRALKALRPEVIISDVWMPNMDGYQFCRAVKRDPDPADIPLILLTSLSERKDIIQGLNAGADYYLTKPYSKELLLSMVRSIIANRESSSAPVGAVTLDIESRGATERISANPRQILNFLFSTYENLISHNNDLSQARRELRSANDRLEERIKEKTLSLEQEVRERRRANEALKKTLSGTVLALARVVEMRDPYTAGHQMRVGQLASSIARELGFSEDRLEGIRTMGLLHDIGKIIVPAEILAKPSKLTDYEFLFIKAHVQAGYDILQEIQFPWPVAEGVVQHHERIDGSGYPAGLRGDEIMMEAKILAVADVAESMSSHRPYRPALGLKAALEEISRNKGVLYDSDVCDVLPDVFTGFSIL